MDGHQVNVESRTRPYVVRAGFCAMVASILALFIAVSGDVAYQPGGLALAMVLAAALMVALTRTRRGAHALLAAAITVGLWGLAILIEAL